MDKITHARAVHDHGYLAGLLKTESPLRLLELADEHVRDAEKLRESGDPTLEALAPRYAETAAALRARAAELKAETLLAVAVEYLPGVETLETRKSDRLDFHDLAVWNLSRALDAAYDAGARAYAKALE